MGLIKTFLLMLLVFVVGSLILTFLVSPNTFENLKANIQSIHLNLNNNLIAQQQNIPVSNIRVIEFNSGGMYGKCSAIETGAEMYGMNGNNALALQCQNVCGNANLNYDSYNCDKDNLYCSCE